VLFFSPESLFFGLGLAAGNFWPRRKSGRFSPASERYIWSRARCLEGVMCVLWGTCHARWVTTVWMGSHTCVCRRSSEPRDGKRQKNTGNTPTPRYRKSPKYQALAKTRKPYTPGSPTKSEGADSTMPVQPIQTW